MFGPQHLKHLIKFLDGVDQALSQRMLRKHPPDEPALTNELCALLDADTQRAEERLSYTLDQLNIDLAAAGDGLDFEVTLDTYPHNTAMERHVSQSDFGLVLSYDNRILPKENWSKAYLVQAKRLFRNSTSGEYDDRAMFRAVDNEQQIRLRRLATILGDDALRYGLFCPQTPALPNVTRTKVRALHTRSLSSKIFDYSGGLELRDFLARNGGIDAGIWLRSTVGRPTSLMELHNEAFKSAVPFTWFIIEHFTLTFARTTLRETLDSIVTPGRPDNDRVRQIVTGDHQAIRELIKELEQAGEDRDAPATITVLPRHTISVRVTVGGALLPDEAPAHID
ncbi:hypothetical protein [Mesorhizobium sp. WSM4313]|uniref:hypothetical protein n=1 Tax=Mesorhizobium sp. WSM4313 TaxID=2029412 RepID=UPI000BD5C87E|nr:hypothetical protein [Mesorhizobium sp. WSM4313]PBB20406.1 hypothetical protein CK219_10585 [Mesorhizobium sp. WSM4313]